jgi:hypothetical protein
MDEIICHVCGHHHPDRNTVYFLLDGRYQCMNAFYCTSTQNQDGQRSGH